MHVALFLHFVGMGLRSETFNVVIQLPLHSVVAQFPPILPSDVDLTPPASTITPADLAMVDVHDPTALGTGHSFLLLAPCLSLPLRVAH